MAESAAARLARIDRGKEKRAAEAAAEAKLDEVLAEPEDPEVPEFVDPLAPLSDEQVAAITNAPMEFFPETEDAPKPTPDDLIRRINPKHKDGDSHVPYVAINGPSGSVERFVYAGDAPGVAT